jgi:hypothetical protein
VGRFIQQDPAGDGINWYAYAGNNPITEIAPEGLKLEYRGDHRAIQDALGYLRMSDTMSDIIDELRDSPDTYTIATTYQKWGRGPDDDVDFYDPCTRTILWNPRAALGWGPGLGGRISPALVLGHELGHADESPWLLRFNQARTLWMGDYDNAEKRVIRKLENATARELGEAIRPHHRGHLYWVRKPTTR